jgi:pimeloyl-ACP methyl ester carboxylesterase
VLIDNADGTFQPRLSFTTGQCPVAIAAADFNGDGKIDLAVANQTDSTVSVFFGNGDGTFQARTDYPVAVAPSAIAFADLNGDRKPDVVVLNDGLVSVFLGNGDGSFQPRIDSSNGVSYGGSMAVGDLDGDGLPDLVTTDPSYSGTLAISLGNGDGTFRFAARYILPPDAVTVGDFNRDGRPDLAVAQGTYYGFVSVLLGTGDGNSQVPIQFPTNRSPRSVVTADFDGDGILDLAVGGSSTSILLGNGDGTFQTHMDHVGGAYALTTADFDGDGRPDLAAATLPTFVSVFLNKPAAQRISKPPSITSVSPPSGTQGQTIPNFTVNGSNFDSAAVLSFGGPGITPKVPYTSHTSTQIIADLTIDANAPVGAQDVIVTNSDGQKGTLPGGFTVLSAGQPGISVSPVTLSFTVLSGTTSPVNTITITNTGTATLLISSIATGSPFVLVGQLPTSVTAGGQATLGIKFVPTQPGSFSDKVTIVSNASTSPTEIPLQGTALSTTFGIVDPVPSLLPGSNITTNPDLLATGGRPVVGVAADGVARVVLRIPANHVGEQFSVAIINDHGVPSTSMDEDGGLEAIGGATFQSAITVSAVSTRKMGPMAFAIYRAPVDFPRPAAEFDWALTQRSVTLEFGSTTTPAYAFDIPIEILRPPVVLIHGIWSDPTAWNFFDPLWCEPFAPPCPDSRFVVFLADYSSTNGGGFVPKATRIQAQILDFTKSFKLQKNSAAVQVDVVAHSMGGDIVRAAVLSPIYLRDSNYQQGEIHKLITLDTPHLGSEFATRMLGTSNLCKSLFEGLTGLLVKGGAIIDLAIGSDILKSLKKSTKFPIRAHMVVGIADAQQTSAADNAILALVAKGLCSDFLPLGGFEEVFKGQPSDLVVSQTSQQADGLDFNTPGLPTPPAAETIIPIPVVHTVKPFLFTRGPDVLSRTLFLGQTVGADTGIPQLVINLLNDPIQQGDFEQIRP